MLFRNPLATGLSVGLNRHASGNWMEFAETYIGYTQKRLRDTHMHSKKNRLAKQLRSTLKEPLPFMSIFFIFHLNAHAARRVGTDT